MWSVMHLTFSAACQFCKGTENTNELIKIPSPVNNSIPSCLFSLDFHLLQHIYLYYVCLYDTGMANRVKLKMVSKVK